MSCNHNLVQPFYENAVTNPHAHALLVGNQRFSYRQLADLARRVAGWLLQNPVKKSGRVGILASRTIETYAGVLGTVWSGAAYVPINPHIPEDRLVRILKMAEFDALVVDQAGAKSLSANVLQYAPSRILFGEGIEFPPSPLSAFDIRFTSIAQLPIEDGPEHPVPVPDDTLAYIIFTSGTTGTPKGVMIETGSVVQLIDVLQKRYQLRPNDRVSQAFELTFDVSVFDMFMTWSAGAGLYVVPENQVMAPSKFIRDHQLTIWYSVPSIALFMQKLRMLTPGAFPHLRLSLFVGEALPLLSAQAWQAAAPNSIVENTYGPAEATVICHTQVLTDPPVVTPNRGILAIGNPLEGIEAEIVDADLKPVAGSEPGELILAGRQLARGYYNASDITAARFPTIRGRRSYRTGDLAYRDENGIFHFLGRIDNQVKIMGNRIELEEVDAHLREIVGSDLVSSVAWPVVDGRATGLIAFHCSPDRTREQVRDGMRKRVPDYMIPQRIYRLDSLPLGSSGKIDRKALFRMLEEGLIQA